MAAITRTPRSRWIEEGLRALAAGGPDAVRVEALAQALGVTKGGFYGHFADRNALLGEMLDMWERMSTDEVLERVERQGGDVRARLRLAGALTFSSELLPIDLAIRDWSRRDQAVAERLRRVDNRRMNYLRLLFSAICRDENEVEARSTLAFSSGIFADTVTSEKSRPEYIRSVSSRSANSTTHDPHHVAQKSTSIIWWEGFVRSFVNSAFDTRSTLTGCCSSFCSAASRAAAFSFHFVEQPKTPVCFTATSL